MLTSVKQTALKVIGWAISPYKKAFNAGYQKGEDLNRYFVASSRATRPAR